ncbi:mitochondrial intermembrane space import and assembly protein 40-like protein [Iris pallida]|uniref:Mitochondrial intermembrane space import and assembly protein 40 homolog n=1 Tax=Iris pallida TaxID=29817 RepID=A0AAX6I9R0_IRIPA|nr:mitochondrial intermembrane space import and assembly protein 40-like protein [Iris pallida]KAJ6849653.1 mitochondrial intermembrane space import and assembly protein 40-like protein [Iris pallida]
MGQSQSGDASRDLNQSPTPATTSESSPAAASSPPSLEALIAEATDFGGDDENESLDVKAQRALECPCVAELRKGPCGTQFSQAFVCFIKSTAEEKGSDCVSPFILLQNCIKANPDAFPEDVLEDEKEEDEKIQDYKIIAPSWSRETRSRI